MNPKNSLKSSTPKKQSKRKVNLYVSRGSNLSKALVNDENEKISEILSKARRIPLEISYSPRDSQ